MSEDRTQTPSKRRRQFAREQGQVPHSPELTAACGWLVAAAALGLWGSGVFESLVGQARDPLVHSPRTWVDVEEFTAQLRHCAWSLFLPLGWLIGGFVAGAVAAHQLQVRGLWATALIAPDASRLWAPGRGGSMAAGAQRVAWALVKATILVGVSFWSLRLQWPSIRALGGMEPSAMAAAAGSILLRPIGLLGVLMVALGLVDFALRHYRFEAMLRTTPQEQREDHKAMEGDPSLRGRRRRLARAWRGDDPSLLAGASLMLLGDSGLTLILAGGPPPRRMTVRMLAQRTKGLRLRRTGFTARLPAVEAPSLTVRIARHASSKPSGTMLPPDLSAELAPHWPVVYGIGRDRLSW